MAVYLPVLSSRSKFRFKHKLTALAILAVLSSGCGGDGNTTLVAAPANAAPAGNAQALVPETNAPANNTELANALILTGVFIDSPVANISFSTPSGSGNTNENGEFFYQPGEHITFSIGDITLPPVPARALITPLDIFSATSVTDNEVTNLSRLLQSLDTDANPENGIFIPDAAQTIRANNAIVFSDDDAFEQTAAAALGSAGLNAPLVSSAEALTHLSNSLLARDLIDVSQITTAAVQFDETQNTRSLPDLDQDGIADVFDWDIDGDEIADRLDSFPLDPLEAFDFDNDGIGNNQDTDDDNDGVTDINDAFPLIASESIDSDGDGFGDTLDTDDDNDGVPDVFDAFPLDPLEQLDTDGDGTGNAADNDDDGDTVADGQDAFPLIATEWRDTDNDGYGDNFDHDDDNDGVPDSVDRFPLISSEQQDTDNDGTGNNADPDDDNDGFIDTLDAFPLLASERLDSDQDGLGNNFDLDDDNDGVPDSIDRFPTNPAEQLDTDNDGIGNNADEDDDGDGIDDAADPSPLSENNATDLDGDGFPDSVDDDNDNDGVHDALDVFPNDSTEWSDNDKDNIGDNADPDDDNDGTPDTADALPLNPAEISDIDGDGIGDNADTDSDNDGVDDDVDAFPLNASESFDTDEDGIGDNADPDDDDDGTLDEEDAFPQNPFETIDTDGDGIGDNSDNDSDNDGIEDYWDAFPSDPAESSDRDGDGIGDNADPDDDNDNTPDTEDPFPLQAYYNADTDNDGIFDQWDDDDDNDGIDDFYDELPKDPTESIDSDGDGIGNNADTDDDNDNVLDVDDFAPLNSNCSTEEDSIGGICMADFLQNTDFLEQVGSSMFVFSAESTDVMQMQLGTEEILASIDLSTFIDAGDSITAVTYLPSHNRIYVGFSSGVIVYFDDNSIEGTYFHTLPDSVGELADAGNFLLAQESGYDDTTYVLDSDGVLLSTESSTFDRLTHTAWNSSDSKLYFHQWFSGVGSRTIDQTTGAVTYNTGISLNINVQGQLEFSPDNSLLLAANGQTINFGDTISAGGILGSNTFTDFDWNATGELIAIHASDEDTTVEHYTTDYIVADSVTFTGVPRKLFEHTGTFYVVSETTDGISINSFVPSTDSDNDLVLNTEDAFPTDAAASIDTDGDGSPDQWNAGYSETDSTTGLVIDAYPQDPSCHLAEDGNGEHCFYDLIVPVIAPTTVASNANLTYLHYQDENLVFIRDSETDSYLKPIYVGEDEGTQVLTPAIMTLHPEHNRLYFGYPSGNVTYVDLDSEEPTEQYFVTLAESVRSIAHAGQFVMLLDNAGAWVSHYYYDIDGNLTDSADWNYFSEHYTWSDTNNRLYFFRDDTSPNDLLNEELSADGMILSEDDSPYHGDYSITGPIILSPDQTNVLLGASEYYDTLTLERLGSISRSFEHALYLDDGRLAIVKANGTDTILAYYDTAYAPIAGVTTLLNAEPVGMYYHNGTLTVITYSILEGLVYHDIP